jgi:hypothetical protein
MKQLLLVALLALVSIGCIAPRVPQTVIKTPFGEFRGPKDMVIEGLQFQHSTNGTIVLTAKSISSRNNPEAITASEGQIEAHYRGASVLLEKLAKGAVTGAKPGP